MTDESFMQQAIREAEKAFENNEVPEIGRAHV